jgi:peroxisomal membrane protein 4
MILLYRRDQSVQSNLNFLYQAAREHGINLASFVLLYKLLRCKLQNTIGLSKGSASFISGGLSGGIVWGRSKTAINYQVVLYLLSRIVTGGVHHQVNEGRVPDIAAFKPMAAFVWAMVMYLFSVDPKSLQGSLRSSMEFLYNDENTYGPRTGKWGIPGHILPFIPFSGV